MNLVARKLTTTKDPYDITLPLPSGYAPLAVLPARELSADCGDDLAFVLAIRAISWKDWERFAKEHEALDDGIFERFEGQLDELQRDSPLWVPSDLAHPPHVRWMRLRVDNAVLAGLGPDGRLYRLVTTPVEDHSAQDLAALMDNGDMPADLLEELRNNHWSSKLGGAPSFSQATLRARSRSRGELLPFLAQLAGDVVCDPFGYTFYVFGDLVRSELAMTYQR